MVSNIIGKNIKELLEEHNMLPAELATKLGVSRSTVSMWLKGNKVPRMDKVEKMCILFNCTRGRILAESEVKIDALEEDILRMFRELTNSQKITMYNSVKILYEGFKNA